MDEPGIYEKSKKYLMSFFTTEHQSPEKVNPPEQIKTGMLPPHIPGQVRTGVIAPYIPQINLLTKQNRITGLQRAIDEERRKLSYFPPISTKTFTIPLIIMGMNMNIYEIPKILKKQIEEYNQKDWNQAMVLEKKMRQDEEVFYKKGVPTTCSQETLKKLQNKIGNIDFKKLKKLSNKYFFDPAVMQSIMCVTNSLFYLNSSGDDLTRIQRIKSWINIKKVIGKPSVIGVAMSASFDEANDLFVVKAPKKIDSNNDLLHEWFVGVYGTNQLRKHVPNFAYIYGGFTCSGPISEQGGNVAAYCNLSDKLAVNYILYESIFPSMTMEDYMVSSTLNFTDWLSYYLQILFSLKIAKDLIGFTHYDLHTQNVLLRDLVPSKKVFHIPYKYKNKWFYIKTNKIATMIDFGYSHIKYKGKHYGYPGVERYGINSEKTRPLYDAFKLLGFSIRYLSKKNYDSSVLQKMFPIAKFFYNYGSSNPVVEPFTLLIPYSQSLPSTPQIDKFTIEDLIDYILINEELQPYIKKILKFDKRVKNVIGCDGSMGVCLDVNKRYDELNVNISESADENITVRDSIEYYDVVKRLTSQGKLDSVKEIRKKFQPKMKNSVSLDERKLFELYKSVLDQAKIPIQIINRNIRVNTSVLDQAINTAASASKIMENLTTIKIYEKSIKYTLDYYDKPELEKVKQVQRKIWTNNSDNINDYIYKYLTIIYGDVVWIEKELIRTFPLRNTIPERYLEKYNELKNYYFILNSYFGNDFSIESEK